MRALLESAQWAPRAILASIWSPVAACPIGELCERAAELAFEASDVGAVADALEPFEHHRHFLAVLPDLFDWRLRERNRPTQRLRQDLRRLRHRSYVTGEIDLAAVQAAASVNARAPNQPMSSTAIICSFVPCPSAQASVEPWRLNGASRFSMKNTGRRITCEGKRRLRTVSSMRHLLSKCGMPVRLCADPTDV